jgi:biopolymer transport protein ExbD
MPLKTHIDEQPTLNLTPMIDIVFLIIIFFMVGTKFSELERNISLQVPQVSDVSTLSSAPERKVVSIFSDGRITLNRRELSLTELQQDLANARQQYQDLGVIVRGDAGCPFQSVASVLSACHAAGIAEMGISVRMADKSQAKQYR